MPPGYIESWYVYNILAFKLPQRKQIKLWACLEKVTWSSQNFRNQNSVWLICWITLKHTYPEKSGHGRKYPFLPSKRLFFVVPSIGFAVPGTEEKPAGELEEESIVGSNFSPASTIVGGWRMSSEGWGLAWHSHIFWLWDHPRQPD